MDELRELYQEIILDHNRNPKNFRVIENPDRRVAEPKFADLDGVRES